MEEEGKEGLLFFSFLFFSFFLCFFFFFFLFFSFHLSFLSPNHFPLSPRVCQFFVVIPWLGVVVLTPADRIERIERFLLHASFLPSFFLSFFLALQDPAHLAILHETLLAGLALFCGLFLELRRIFQSVFSVGESISSPSQFIGGQSLLHLARICAVETFNQPQVSILCGSFNSIQFNWQELSFRRQFSSSLIRWHLHSLKSLSSE